MGRSFVVVALAALLAACGLKAPNVSEYTALCKDSAVLNPSSQDAEILFISSALKDCREGKLDLSGFRYVESTFGHAIYSDEGEPRTVDATAYAASEEVWEQTLRARIAATSPSKETGKGKLTVLIHGFNNSFKDALDHAARVAREDEEGVPVVLLHWPSRAAAVSYTFDEATAAWSQELINQRLGELTTMADDITVVAHSMGTRLAVNGVIALDRVKLMPRPGEPARDVNPGHIRRVVLASPDIDRHLVLRDGGSADLLLAKGKWNRKLAIYTSYRDIPINLSRRVHAFERLGSTSCQYDVHYDRRPLGKRGNCHLSRHRDGLFVVSTSRLKDFGPLQHNDFVFSCRARAHLSAFLRGEKKRPYEGELGERGSDQFGYEIDPLISDPNDLCPTEER